MKTILFELRYYLAVTILILLLFPINPKVPTLPGPASDSGSPFGNLRKPRPTHVDIKEVSLKNDWPVSGKQARKNETALQKKIKEILSESTKY